MINKNKLGDTEFPIRFSFNALVKFEDLIGESPFSVLQDMEKLNSPRVLRALVYSGIYGGYKIQGEDMPLSVEEIGDKLDFKNLDKYIEVFTKDLLSEEKKGKAVKEEVNG